MRVRQTGVGRLAASWLSWLVNGGSAVVLEARKKFDTPIASGVQKGANPYPQKWACILPFGERAKGPEAESQQGDAWRHNRTREVLVTHTIASTTIRVLRARNPRRVSLRFRPAKRL